MSNKFNKKMAQKGGMMIEALAMLGLIAVVTPTMYKKSAERTLEVEDINTATTMRSVMTAADSYVASHYGELVQEIANNAENNQAKVIGLDKLKPYLPYGFNTNKLYDYSDPKVSVVRNGNNLTAFVLFPAKEKGEDGLGQERTVRIATLVGANGGYVNNGEGEDNTTAKGIGGIWNLSAEEFTKVFGNADPNIYSIVTASSDAINNTNTEEDTDKFLYRTDADGRWHNTMRADLFMGDNKYDTNDVKTADGYYKEGTYSIRSVKSLIIGAEEASKHSETDDEGKSKEVEDSYGLYIASGSNPDAYIHGSLEAVEKTFSVSRDELKYRPNNSLVAEGMPMFQMNDEGFFVSEGDLHIEGTDSSTGRIFNTGDIDLANEENGWSHINIGNTRNNELISGTNGAAATADTPERAANLRLLGGIEINDITGANDRVIIANGDVAGGNAIRYSSTTSTCDPDDENCTPTESSNAPLFPVRIGANTRVDAILATRQLDTQNIRAATLDVGSTNIDDENKWLKVDANGIHGRNPAAVSGDKTKTNTVFDVKNGEVNIATGTFNRNDSNFDTDNGANNSFRMTDSDDDAGIELASKQKINLRNTKVQQQIQGSDVVFSSLQKGTTDDPKNTSVKVKGTNFQVQDTSGKVVLSVKGNDKARAINDTDIDTYTAGTDEKANFAVHGETLFTSSMNDSNSDADRKYMKIGSNYNNEAMVNIVQNDKTLSQVLTIDGDSEPNEVPNSSRYDKKVNTEGAQADGTGGTVYIRKGMVEVMPRISETGGKSDISLNSIGTTYSADKGYGVVKASRFVANNMKYKVGTEEVDPTKVPQFFTNKEFNKYNYGSDKTDDPTGRYDTYMVNPAYTSVMHDIKLTTRGGARLSDILPDFINKGIYITTNTYKDNIKSMKFKFDSTDGVQPDGGNAASLSGEIVLGNADSWASPYLGFVPAPQCPPGYNRLITLAPQSFMMAQAGQMQRSATGQDHPRGGYAYYTKNQVPEDSAFTEYNNAMGSSNGQYIQQGFVKVAADNVDVDTSNLTVDNKKVNGTAVAKTSELNLHEVDAGGNTIEGRPGNPYFLVSYGDTTPPLTIQQSTWLKTNVIPVGEGTASIETPGTGYIKGWAALMGFVYDAATYQPIIDKLSGQNLIAYDGSSNSVYWNIFPVRRSTLEAYATTYCYFDRNGIYWNEFKNGANGEYIDHYNAVNDYKTNTEKKNISEEYKQRLNDPTLKYDEVW